MPKFILRVTKVLMLLLAISGCSNISSSISADQEVSFQNLVPIENMNSSLRIKVYSTSDMEFGSVIDILVENVSDDFLFFSTSTSPIKLFLVRDNNWVEIINDYTYFSITGGDSYILSPSTYKQQPNTFITSVRPVLLPNDITNGREQIVRVLILGELMSDNIRTGVQAGAYTDLLLRYPE